MHITQSGSKIRFNRIVQGVKVGNTDDTRDKKENSRQDSNYHQPTFSVFLSSLGMQAMIALGKLKNPLTDKLEENHVQARFLIDTLEMIKEKTKNNLDTHETKLLDECLFNLRMLYVEAKKSD